MSKWGRNYILNAQLSNGDNLIVSYPVTMQFSVRRDNNPSAGSGSFRLFNLSQAHRNLIYKDTAIDPSLEHIQKLEVQAGYGNNLSTIFYGDISSADSYRQEGTTDIITEINGWDGWSSRICSMSNWTLQGPVTRKQVIARLVQDLERTGQKVGKISEFKDVTYPKYTAPNVRTWDLLQEETEYHCNIYNDQIYCLNDDDTVDGPILNINSDTGLLGSPRKYDTFMEVEMLFEPKAFVGQQAIVNSSAYTLFNGEYKVTAVHHHGTISGAVNSKCKTTVQLYVLKRQKQLAGL